MSGKRADQIARSAGHCVEEQIPRGPVQFLNHGADVHQDPHIENDVQYPAVQKNCSNEAPGLINMPRGLPPGAAKPCIRAVMTIDRPNITQQIVSMEYVTGEVCGIHRPRDLLAAAKENLMLAPHWW